MVPPCQAFWVPGSNTGSCACMTAIFPTHTPNSELLCGLLESWRPPSSYQYPTVPHSSSEQVMEEPVRSIHVRLSQAMPQMAPLLSLNPDIVHSHPLSPEPSADSSSKSLLPCFGPGLEPFPNQCNRLSLISESLKLWKSPLMELFTAQGSGLD